MKLALIELSIKINISPFWLLFFFSFYSNGVYYEPTCGNTLDDLDHAVGVVGYGEMNGQLYWLVKNSWSNLWGNDG